MAEEKAQALYTKRKVQRRITLTFDLLGDEAECIAQYRWFKKIEKTTLAAYMQAWFQCETETK